jgi:hypothetical protein
MIGDHGGAESCTLKYDCSLLGSEIEATGMTEDEG